MKYKGYESYDTVIHLMIIIVIINAQNKYVPYKVQLQNLKWT